MASSTISSEGELLASPLKKNTPVRAGDVFRSPSGEAITVIRTLPGGRCEIRIQGKRMRLGDFKHQQLKALAKIGRADYLDGAYTTPQSLIDRAAFASTPELPADDASPSVFPGAAGHLRYLLAMFWQGRADKIPDRKIPLLAWVTENAFPPNRDEDRQFRPGFVMFPGADHQILLAKALAFAQDAAHGNAPTDAVPEG